MGDRRQQRERVPRLLTRRSRGPRQWGWRMEVKEGFGSALGEEAKRAKQNVFFFALCFRPFPLWFWEEGDQGALLGSIRSVWDRIWSCLKSLPS